MAAITTGLSALLYMCGSGEIDKTSTINYLLYVNNYDKSIYNSAPINEKIFATYIANSLGYNIEFHGPYDWWCPPHFKKNSNSEKIKFSPPEVRVEKLNHVSANALVFLNKILSGTEVEIFPEGASCFSRFRSLGVMPNIWVKQFRPRIVELFKQNLTNRSFFVKKYWLLPDRFGRVRFATKNTFGVDVLDEKKLYKSYKKSALFFIDKYAEFDLSKYSNNIIFHPILENLNESDYQLWLKKNEGIIDNSVFFIKTKPRMKEVYIPKAFKKYNFFHFPIDLNVLPAELILEPLINVRYFGYYSTIALGFQSNMMTIDAPPDLYLANGYNRTYAGLKAVLSV